MKLLKNRPRTEINIVPLVDVLIVLIFFFMMTMQFRDERVLNITPPEMETAGQNKSKDPLIIGVNKEGQYFFNDIEVGTEDLIVLVNEAKQESVLIVADEEAALKFTTTVMDIARKAGLEKIRLQTR